MNAQNTLALEVHDQDTYPAGFFAWIETDEGKAIWTDFEKRSLQMAKVRKRYSAMAVAQVIRWYTALQDGTEFKLNNNWVPGLARLWMQKHGEEHPGFFEMRDTLGRTVNAA